MHSGFLVGQVFKHAHQGCQCDASYEWFARARPIVTSLTTCSRRSSATGIRFGCWCWLMLQLNGGGNGRCTQRALALQSARSAMEMKRINTKHTEFRRVQTTVGRVIFTALRLQYPREPAYRLHRDRYTAEGTNK